MADPIADLPERMTLRYWPWLVMCLAGAVAFGLLTWVAMFAVLNSPSAVVQVLAALLTVGLAVLAVYTVLSLRTRSVVDRTGSVAHGATSRDRVVWRDVDRLDVIHFLPGWAIRAWANGTATVVYLCHDTHGRRPRSSTHQEPPPEAPRSVHTGFVAVNRYWRSAREG